MLLYYSYWNLSAVSSCRCDHCDTIKREFVIIAKAMEAEKSLDKSVMVGQIDCLGTGKKICTKYSIKILPDFIVFDKKRPQSKDLLAKTGKGT